MKLLTKVLGCLLVVSIGINAYLFVQSKFYVKAPTESPESYPLLSPRIFAERQNDILLNFLPLRKQLRDLIGGYDNTFYMYFEYLPSGTSIGVNEKNEFMAASLIKVPIVMAHYHELERVGFSLDSDVKIEDRDIDKGFGNLWQVGVGGSISKEQAAVLALTKSDNTALMVLANRVAQEDFDAVYEGLDIDYRLENKEAIITAKQYTSILKALYFSSLLSKKNSQHILDLLTKTDFKNKIPAGIPEGISVAHKVGILGNDLWQDCGIIFVPNRPYALCMISASPEDVANDRMRTISKTVYEFVENYGKDK